MDTDVDKFKSPGDLLIHWWFRAQARKRFVKEAMVFQQKPSDISYER